MRNSGGYLGLFLICVALRAIALEPLFIIKLHDDYIEMNNTRFNGASEVMEKLSALKSPDEVYLHAHVCLNSSKMNEFTEKLMSKYKIHLSSYGSHQDADCH